MQFSGLNISPGTLSAYDVPLGQRIINVSASLRTKFSALSLMLAGAVSLRGHFVSKLNKAVFAWFQVALQASRCMLRILIHFIHNSTFRLIGCERSTASIILIYAVIIPLFL